MRGQLVRALFRTKHGFRILVFALCGRAFLPLRALFGAHVIFCVQDHRGGTGRKRIEENGRSGLSSDAWGVLCGANERGDVWLV
ncbi:hypothetical protein CSA80_02410 [Candidatus Saccharibacteria bacterium]|nr:MAG: hypothetical protein CSA80_02410 [Candidatus Saccharibacteria bacterium]